MLELVLLTIIIRSGLLYVMPKNILRLYIHVYKSARARVHVNRHFIFYSVISNCKMRVLSVDIYVYTVYVSNAFC